METSIVHVSSLRLDNHNARIHDKRNIDAIKRSLQRFGQQKPIVVNNKGVVVAGNGTLEAAIGLGWSDVAVVRTGLEGDEAAAYAIADNKTSELGTWDERQLKDTLEELNNNGFDSSVIGFTDKEVNDLIGGGSDYTDIFVPEYLVLITCTDEEEQSEVFSNCEKLGYKTKLVS